ncbi:MAG TPA: fumarylacetoacetate hydrolase family protein [Candidatus Polarisedimenticolaceae bacterium]|nr:fumarylacetoacetate hydrolase family protein [Candidatus Polarisedimenticolaceae bacterium]
MPLPPFNQYLGIDVTRMAGGEAEAVVDLKPHHTNNRGVAHGGVVLSLLDSAMGAAVISAIPKEWWCATTGLSVQFVAGPREGRVVGVGRVLKRGKSVAFVHGEAHDASGRLVATAQGTWHLWPYLPEMAKVASEPFVILEGTGERLRVGKILAVGRNYAAHNREMGTDERTPPVLFLKPPSALVHDGGTVVLPRDLGAIHHEVEMVAVIGKRGREIPESMALDHVLGFAVGIDLTLRDLQNEAKKKGEPWDLAKGFDGAAPVSLVVPREHAGDPGKLALTLAVNGETRQSGSTAQMLHSVGELVALASRLITLERGDLLFTGTPSGVGPVVPGDVLTARLGEIAGLTVTAR